MNIDEAKGFSYDELRTVYKEYLSMQGYSHNTVQTAYNDSFYLWNKSGEEIFWKVVESDDFETEAKNELLIALKTNSKGDPAKLVNGYLSHLRRFRRFLESDVSNPQNGTERKHSDSTVKRKKAKTVVPKPCPEEVEFYLKQWDALEDYHLQEDALDKLFFELCPANDNVSDILIKVATLNDFYSTNIFKVYAVAKHILSLNIDDRLRSGDVTLVADIKNVEINGTIKSFYSFATKYCSHHKPLDFPIYDSYVEKVLLHFRKVDQFTDFDDQDLKDYSKFKEILCSFRHYYGLDEYNLKEVDKYLWQLGKRYFPKKYKKENKDK